MIKSLWRPYWRQNQNYINLTPMLITWSVKMSILELNRTYHYWYINIKLKLMWTFRRYQMSSRAPNLINFDKTYRDSIVRVPVVGCLWKKNQTSRVWISIYSSMFSEKTYLQITWNPTLTLDGWNTDHSLGFENDDFDGKIIHKLPIYVIIRINQVKNISTEMIIFLIHPQYESVSLP